MRIPYELFKEQAGQDLHKSGLHAIGRAHAIMCERYCDKMTLRSLCPRECQKCFAVLGRNLPFRVDYGNPYALFTWKMKDAFAKAAEASAKAHRVQIPQNMLGETIESNPFDSVLEVLDA